MSMKIILHRKNTYQTAFIILMEILLQKCDKNVTNCMAGLESPAKLVYDSKVFGFFRDGHL